MEEVKEILEQTDVDGRTVLHIAAFVDNKCAMKLLVEKHKDLLTMSDREGQDPLIIALNNMHFDSFLYLLEAAVDNDQAKQLVISHKKRGASFLVNAITAKQYSECIAKISHKYYDPD